MEDSNNCDIARDEETVAAILYQMTTELKCDLQRPLSIDSISCSDCEARSVVSMKEGCGSPLSSWDSEPKTDISSITHCHVMTEESLLDVNLEGNCGDLEEENAFVVVEYIDDSFSWEMDNRSYEDLLKKFFEKEEELRVSNSKLQLSEQEIVGLKVQVENSESKEEELRVSNSKLQLSEQENVGLRVQVENSESEINDLHEALELKEDELYEQKELSYREIFKLVNQIKKSESQLDIVRRELNLKNGQLENVRGELKLKICQLVNVRRELYLKNGELDNVRQELNLKNGELDNVRKELELKTGQFDNVCQELKLKAEELNEQMELSNEEIFKLKTEIKDLRKEVDSKSPMTHELQCQIKEEKENMAILKCELETLVRTNEDNDINHMKGMSKLISTMFDLHVKSFWKKEELRSNVASLSKQKEELTSKLEYYESRNKELEQGYEAEKLHSTRVTNLQDEISYLRKKLGERKNDVELNRMV